MYGEHPTYVCYPMPDCNEFMCTLAVVAVMNRAIADEIARSIGRCEHLDTLVRGSQPLEPGGAAAWPDSALDHSQVTYHKRTYSTSADQLASARGSRSILWPSLARTPARHEHVGASPCAAPGWNLMVAFTGIQVSAICGEQSASGGMLNDAHVFTYFHQNCKGFLNGADERCTLTRNNKVHLLSLFLSLGGQSVDLEYQVRYRDEVLSTFCAYVIPMGRVRRVRCVGTASLGEAVTSCSWLAFLPEAQLSVTDVNDIRCPLLYQAAQLPRSVVHDNWYPLERAGTEHNHGDTCPGLALAPCTRSLGIWRVKTAIPGPLAANAQGLEGIVAAMAGGAASARRIQHISECSVQCPWEFTTRTLGVESHDRSVLMVDGDSPFLSALARRLGVSAVDDSTAANLAKAAVDSAQQRSTVVGATAVMPAELLEKMAAQMTAMCAALAAQGQAADSGGSVKLPTPADLGSKAGVDDNKTK